MANQSNSITVYTDGACRGNPGPGGWAWAVPGESYASGAEAYTTNQRMELTGVLDALRSLSKDVSPGGTLEVVSDSSYVVNCFKQRWWEGWQRKNWKNSQGKPVANQDLWQPLIVLARTDEFQVEFRWVKGHSGDRWNDFVDILATTAADSGKGDRGLINPPEPH